VNDAKTRRRQKGEPAGPPGLAALDADQRDRVITEEVSAAYHEGLRVGVRRYAWWQDGVQYVGTGGRTLDQAIATIDAAEAAGEWQPS
jgi:hypothetical protein